MQYKEGQTDWQAVRALQKQSPEAIHSFQATLTVTVDAVDLGCPAGISWLPVLILLPACFASQGSLVNGEAAKTRVQAQET